MTNRELALLIFKAIGGEENIIDYTNCVTRLRFNLKNLDVVDKEQIDRTPSVLGSQFKSGQYQVILGGKVSNVAQEFGKLVSLSVTTQKSNQPKEGVMSRLINTLSAILTPALPPVIAGGMLKGFMFMFVNFGWIDGASDTAIFFNMLSDTMFYFFPFLLAVSSAKRFKTNEFMALTMAGVLMYPMALADGQSVIKLFGFLPIAVVDYSSSVLPIILSVLLLKYISDFFNRVIPEMVSMVFSPLFSLIVAAPIAMLVLAPLGYYIGEYVAIGVKALITFSPWLAGLIVGASRPILVLGGMHHAMNPIFQQELASFGASQLSAMVLMSTFAQATAALVAYFRAKDSADKQIALSAVIPGYIGITEPALYGVLSKQKEAMFAACLGGGIGAAVTAMLGGRGYAFVMPGILSIPSYMGEGFGGVVIGLVVTIVATLVLYLAFQLFFKKPTDTEKIVTSQETIVEKKEAAVTVSSPTKGSIRELESLQDDTFGRSVLGKTLAIKSSSGKIVAPFDGTVQALFQTKHAIGLVSSEGEVELLIHVGIDTVQLQGAPFLSHVKQGQKVQQGELLLTFDQKAIHDADYDDVVVLAVTNSDKHLSILEVPTNQDISSGQALLKIIH